METKGKSTATEMIEWMDWPDVMQGYLQLLDSDARNDT